MSNGRIQAGGCSLMAGHREPIYINHVIILNSFRAKKSEKVPDTGGSSGSPGLPAVGLHKAEKKPRRC